MNTLNNKPFATREDVFEQIKELRSKYGEQASQLDKANEAKTRLLLIDRTLELLGWSKDEFNPEEAIGRRSYLDYLLKIEGVPRLIVEAKRVNYTFHSPRKQSKKNYYSLTYLKTAFGQAFIDVLSQAENYALQNHVPYALLTNGCEWVLVQLVLTPGFIEINDLKGVYFGNLFSDDFNFDLFWEILYRGYVEEGSIESHFTNLNSKEADYSRTPQERFGNFQWQPPQGKEHLQDFYQYFFTEIIDSGRRKMLEKCFVSNTKLDRYQGELQRTLKDTSPLFLEDAIELPPNDRQSLITSESGDQKGRVVLVVGSVGAGKSTLVNKVIVETRQEQTNDKEKKRKFDSLIIDLIDEVGNNQMDIEPKLWGYIRREWDNIKPQSYEHQELCKIFGRQLSQLRKGPYARLFENDEALYIQKEAELLEELTSNPEEYFRECWRYYRQKNYGVIVFFDNVDRASQEYQQYVYAFAHRLASSTGATVIVTMREFTFFRGQEAGFLDVRASDKVFHLSSPDLIQILSKRIKYIENYLDDDHRLSKWKKSDDWEERRNRFLNYAEMLKKTFLIDKEGQDKLAILEAIAWHNVRAFLYNLRQLHIMLGNGYRPWGILEITASLMTSLSANSNITILNNIYRPSFSNFQCYYLKIRVLLLQIAGQPAYQTRKGTSLNSLLKYMRLYGYQERWTKRAIEELVHERFLECLEGPTEADYTKQYTISSTHSYRPSPLAHILIEKIINQPIYLCLIGNDLPFHDQNSFHKYESAVSEMYTSLEIENLERDALDLLPDAKLGVIVATYLIEVYQREQPPKNLLNNIPELGATEQSLSELIKGLGKVADIDMPKSRKSEDITQLALFSQKKSFVPNQIDKIPIPKNIHNVRIARSEQAPLIFWALVALKKGDQHLSTGTEITEVINDYLVDEQNKKAPNNISRALRTNTLQSQPWLLTKVISARRKKFGLNPNWEIYWLQVFDEKAPEIDL